MLHGGSNFITRNNCARAEGEPGTRVIIINIILVKYFGEPIWKAAEAKNPTTINLLKFLRLSKWAL